MASASEAGVSGPMVGTKRSVTDALGGDDVASCGICLAEVEDQGCLDSCQHAYCFDCIMKWSQVESRCPTCKRRFTRVTRASADAHRRGSLRQARSFPIPLKDQVYHPSEEELAVAMQPYAHTVCMRCLECDNEHLLLLCDMCDNAAHTYCVGLGHEVPEGDWFCDACGVETAGASTSGSDTSVSLRDLGDSSDCSSGEEEEETATRASTSVLRAPALSDGDSDAEFCLDVHFDAQPRGGGASSRARRVRRAGRSLGGHARGSDNARPQGRPRGRRRSGARVEGVAPLAGSQASSRRGVGWQAGGRGNRVAREGVARTLQAEVGARLQLQLVRDTWADIQAGTRPFPPRAAPPPVVATHAAHSTQAGTPSGAAPSAVEQMAWKALRALQSGQAGRVACAVATAGGVAGDSAERGGHPARRAPSALLKQKGRGQTEQGTRHRSSSAGMGRRGDGCTLASEGATAVDVFDERAVSRRQANVGWVDDELLEDRRRDTDGGDELRRGWGRSDRRGAGGAVPYRGAPRPTSVAPLGQPAGVHKWRSGGAEMQSHSRGPSDWQRHTGGGGGPVGGGARGSTVSLTVPLLQPLRPWVAPPRVLTAGEGPFLAGRSCEGTHSRECGAQQAEAVGGTPHAVPAERDGRGASGAGGPEGSVRPSLADSGGGGGVCAVGMAGAKRVKDQLAAVVKHELEALYKSKSIDRLQFRKAAEGTTRALLQAPPAQHLYAKLKRGKYEVEKVDRELLCWSCRQSIGSSVKPDLPFCRACVECQVEAQVKLVRSLP